MPFDPTCIFFVFVPIVIALVIYSIFQSQARKKELSAWCSRRGLQFDDSHFAVEGMFPQCGCFSEGHNRYAYNRIWGELDGRGILGFDYHYQTGSGKDETTHTFSAVAVKSPVPLEQLLIRREGLFDKVAGFFGHEDINFESAEFSKRFYVSAPNRKWAYDVLSQRTIEFLLERDPSWVIQFEREWVVVRGGGTWSAAEFEAAVSLAAGILDRLPEYVVQQQEARGA